MAVRWDKLSRYAGVSEAGAPQAKS